MRFESSTKALLSLCLSLAFSLAPGTATAQRQLGAEFAAGTIVFVPDQVVWEGLVGGDVRFYVRPATSIGPEISYVKGEGHSHLLLIGIVNHDVGQRGNGQSRQFVPFVKIGAGVIGSPREIFSSVGPIVTGGGGLRVRAKGPFTFGAEMRLGWVCCSEIDLRAAGTVGVQLGR